MGGLDGGKGSGTMAEGNAKYETEEAYKTNTHTHRVVCQCHGGLTTTMARNGSMREPHAFGTVLVKA